MRSRVLIILGAIVLVVALALVLISSNAAPQADSRLHITLLQLNDVYEITPVSGGAQGGMARVATLRKQQHH